MAEKKRCYGEVADIRDNALAWDVVSAWAWASVPPVCR